MAYFADFLKHKLRSILVISTIKELKKAAEPYRKAEKIGLVPTMGALHEAMLPCAPKYW